ncbi:MAG TPA: hypothetical protein VMO00_07770 [Methylomirabilota bacterium]|nr:hypothetical protein [Methylomirabilota bacterium]
MKILKTICSALLLVSLLALAGCPGMERQDNSGSSKSSGND